MGYDSGPYLQMALLCEKALQERDGVISVIRVIDRFNLAAMGQGSPETLPPTNINATVVVAFKAGSARGSHALTLRPETPAGLKLPPISFTILFEGEDRGAGIITMLGFQVQLEGLYWIDVLLDDELVTRIPLRVVYQRMTMGMSQP